MSKVTAGAEERNSEATAPEAQSPILEVINLTKVFPNGRIVLNGISFQVFPEETFVILGGSGCGKSTLLNILIGVLGPTSGEVRIFGQDLHRLKGQKLKELHIRCGMLFQSGALIESLSLLGNVHLPLREHYRSVDPAVLVETARLKLRMVGLEEGLAAPLSGVAAHSASLAPPPRARSTGAGRGRHCTAAGPDSRPAGSVPAGHRRVQPSAAC